VGEIKEKETVLVTAAAGATGSFAVQLAALAGCHVIGTCGSDAKVLHDLLSLRAVSCTLFS
jgi:NADPH-dependent curcumin reductase CurA